MIVRSPSDSHAYSWCGPDGSCQTVVPSFWSGSREQTPKVIQVLRTRSTTTGANCSRQRYIDRPRRWGRAGVRCGYRKQYDHSSSATARRCEFAEPNRAAAGSTQSQYSADADDPVRISSMRGCQSRFGARTLSGVTEVSKLKIGAIEDDKPVTMTIKLPAAVHRDLRVYAEVLKREGGHTIDLNSLVAAMLARFMATDRAFRRARRQIQNEDG